MVQKEKKTCQDHFWRISIKPSRQIFMKVFFYYLSKIYIFMKVFFRVRKVVEEYRFGNFNVIEEGWTSRGSRDLWDELLERIFFHK